MDASPGDPHDSFDETSIVIASPAGVTLFSRKSSLDDFPLIISQSVTKFFAPRHFSLYMYSVQWNVCYHFFQVEVEKSTQIRANSMASIEFKNEMPTNKSMSSLKYIALHGIHKKLDEYGMQNDRIRLVYSINI